jgi:Glycosyl hydrolase family 47
MQAQAQVQVDAHHVQPQCRRLYKTLQVMGAKAELREAVAWAGAELSFDIDKRVHVFELTIRALGGLLSAHALLQADPALVPGANPEIVCTTFELAVCAWRPAVGPRAADPILVPGESMCTGGDSLPFKLALRVSRIFLHALNLWAGAALCHGLLQTLTGCSQSD